MPYMNRKQLEAVDRESYQRGYHKGVDSGRAQEKARAVASGRGNTPEQARARTKAIDALATLGEALARIVSADCSY